MDNEAVEIQPTLTSTVDSVLFYPNNDKNDANDSTPTSSTDAASTYSTSLNVTDDPISSTSSDVDKTNISDEKINIDNNDMDVSKNLLGAEGDVDLLDISMENASSEPISEDVEDIVQDLENLLGESEPINDFSSRRKPDSKSIDKEITDSKDPSNDEKKETDPPEALDRTNTLQIKVTNITEEISYLPEQLIEPAENLKSIDANITSENSNLQQDSKSELCSDSIVQEKPETAPLLPQPESIVNSDMKVESVECEKDRETGNEEGNSSSQTEMTSTSEEVISKNIVQPCEVKSDESLEILHGEKDNPSSLTELTSTSEEVIGTGVDETCLIKNNESLEVVDEAHPEIDEKSVNTETKHTLDEIEEIKEVIEPSSNKTIEDSPKMAADIVQETPSITEESEQNISPHLENRQDEVIALEVPMENTVTDHKINQENCDENPGEVVPLKSCDQDLTEGALEAVPSSAQSNTGIVIDATRTITDAVDSNSEAVEEKLQDVDVTASSQIKEPQNSNEKVIVEENIDLDKTKTEPDNGNITLLEVESDKIEVEDVITQPRITVHSEDQTQPQKEDMSEEVGSFEINMKEPEVKDVTEIPPESLESKEQSDAIIPCDQEEIEFHPQKTSSVMSLSEKDLEDVGCPQGIEDKISTEESSTMARLESNRINHEPNNEVVAEKIEEEVNISEKEHKDDKNDCNEIMEGLVGTIVEIPEVSLAIIPELNTENIPHTDAIKEDSTNIMLEQKINPEEIQTPLGEGIEKMVEVTSTIEEKLENESDRDVNPQKEIQQTIVIEEIMNADIEKNNSSELEVPTNEELVPVVEEFIVKKTIIYDHPCSHHDTLTADKDSEIQKSKNVIQVENSEEDCCGVPADSQLDSTESIGTIPTPCELKEEPSVLLEDETGRSKDKSENNEITVEEPKSNKSFDESCNKANDAVELELEECIEVKTIDKIEAQEIEPEVLEKKTDYVIMDSEEQIVSDCLTSSVDEEKPQETVSSVECGVHISDSEKPMQEVDQVVSDCLTSTIDEEVLPEIVNSIEDTEHVSDSENSIAKEHSMESEEVIKNVDDVERESTSENVIEKMEQPVESGCSTSSMDEEITQEAIMNTEDAKLTSTSEISIEKVEQPVVSGCSASSMDEEIPQEATRNTEEAKLTSNSENSIEKVEQQIVSGSSTSSINEEIPKEAIKNAEDTELTSTSENSNEKVEQEIISGSLTSAMDQDIPKEAIENVEDSELTPTSDNSIDKVDEQILSGCSTSSLDKEIPPETIKNVENSELTSTSENSIKKMEQEIISVCPTSSMDEEIPLEAIENVDNPELTLTSGKSREKVEQQIVSGCLTSMDEEIPQETIENVEDTEPTTASENSIEKVEQQIVSGCSTSSMDEDIPQEMIKNIEDTELLSSSENPVEKVEQQILSECSTSSMAEEISQETIKNVEDIELISASKNSIEKVEQQIVSGCSTSSMDEEIPQETIKNVEDTQLPSTSENYTEKVEQQIQSGCSTSSMDEEIPQEMNKNVEDTELTSTSENSIEKVEQQIVSGCSTSSMDEEIPPEAIQNEEGAEVIPVSESSNEKVEQQIVSACTTTSSDEVIPQEAIKNKGDADVLSSSENSIEKEVSDSTTSSEVQEVPASEQSIEKVEQQIVSEVLTSSVEEDIPQEVINDTKDQEHVSDSEILIQKVEEQTSSSSSASSVDDEVPQEIVSSPEDLEQVSSNIENSMQDQTSAAVQSILDNMLAEEQNVEVTSNKEEPTVVHSSYSSYELQKAVQHIQDISRSDDVEEITFIEEIQPLSCFEDKLDSVENNIKESEVASSQDLSATNPEVPESQLDNIQEESEITSETVEEIQIADSITAQKSPTMHEADVEEFNFEVGSTVTNIEEQVTKSEEELSVESTDEQIASTTQTRPNIPIVEPSIDLSEESSSEDSSEDEKSRNKVTSTVSIVSTCTEDSESRVCKTVGMNENKSDIFVDNSVTRNDSKKNISRDTRQSGKINEKSNEKCNSHKENIEKPLSINVDETEKEKAYSPKVTVKPIKEDELTEEKEEHKGSLKITITKQSDNTHSILKVCSPESERHRHIESDDQSTVPKLVIKTTETDQHSPKMSSRSCKQIISGNTNQRSGSPRITIKPILKPDAKEPSSTSPLKITIKPLGKPEEFSKQQQRHSPKLAKSKSEDDHYGTRSKVLKSSENSEVHSPKVTIKPIVKPLEEVEHPSTPKITIKPVEKPESDAKVSPKITIKPVLRPSEMEAEIEDDAKGRIVLKINKGTIPMKETDKGNRDIRKRELEDDKSEKLAKIKLKFSKGGDAHIVHEAIDKPVSPNKRTHDFDTEKAKRIRVETPNNESDDDVKLIENKPSPIVISEDSRSQDSVIVMEEAKNPFSDITEAKVAVAPVPPPVPVAAPRKRGRPRKVPLVVREDFGNVSKEEPPPALFNVADQPAGDKELTGRPKRSCRGQSVRDTLGIKPRKPKGAPRARGSRRGMRGRGVSMKQKKGSAFSEEKLELIKASLTEEALRDARNSNLLKVASEETENKKVILNPLELKGLLKAAKDQNIIEVIEVESPSDSPGTSKPEEVGCDTDIRKKYIDESRQRKLSKEAGSLKDANIAKSTSVLGMIDAVASDIEMQPPTPVSALPLNESTSVDIGHSSDIAMFEEETRMSAETCSRAHTPPKQVVSADVVVEESQSSVQSTATTESGKASRRGRLEVHQEMDGSIFTADQLNEYYWSGNGPFMIQEQVAQFLGIKSFKRKYPGIPRRMVDMQERDYIRENGLASESMCDLGLTAVNSADILDIMYTDFQEKYEEFCKHQRDRQAKDLLNKQKALSLAANHEKSKLDIIDQAMQSAASYNANFNKVRREQRRACMDLQSMNIHYPKNRIKQIPVPTIGNYPVVVVPGQYTDYYREFTPTELNNLPLNTMLYTELHKILPEVSDSDSDSSGSDTDDSSSSGSDSDSSCGDRCKICINNEKKTTVRKSPIHANA